MEKGSFRCDKVVGADALSPPVGTSPGQLAGMEPGHYNAWVRQLAFESTSIVAALSPRVIARRRLRRHGDLNFRSSLILRLPRRRERRLAMTGEALGVSRVRRYHW